MRTDHHTRLARRLGAVRHWPHVWHHAQSSLAYDDIGATGPVSQTVTSTVKYNVPFRDNIPGSVFATASSEYAQAADDSAYTITAAGLTVSWWWKHSGTYPGANGWLIVTKYSDTSSAYEWQVYVDATKINVQVFNTIAGLLTQNSPTLPAADTGWHHLAVVLPGTTSTSYPVVYFDGRRLADNTTAGSGSYKGDTASLLYWGQRSAALANYYFPGSLRHQIVIPQALGAHHIAALFRQGYHPAYGREAA